MLRETTYPDPLTLSYVDLLSYIGETNRCPGGKRTISQILLHSHIYPGARILEIGSNTGFTSMEIAKLLDCHVIGIDINEQAVAMASELLRRESPIIQKRVSFQVASALQIPFPDDTFDLIVTGGANTFIDEQNRARAFAEYSRVLKPYGKLAVANLFYHSSVPKRVLERVSSILGFSIRPWTRNYWLALILSGKCELYHYEEHMLQARPLDVLERYVSRLIADSPMLQEAPDEVREKYAQRWFEIMQAFNENHRYLAYMLVLLRKGYTEEQQELFLPADAIDIWNLTGPQYWPSLEENS
ncbi:MAG TPA: methyltransferase domain-containing protein [Ktedonobacteraceae bacterium]|nr:methyltransferase domain-containing protein [Ktedonobacteraceae bacterium]